MSVTTALLAAIAVGLVASLVLLVLLMVRRPADARETREGFETLAEAQRAAADRLQREVRAEVLEQARGNRAELSESIGRFARQVTAQASSVAQIQNAQIDGFAQQLARLTESNERRLAEIRATLEAKLRELQADNAGRLEQMRATVDEKLNATLEQRLGESFRLVSDRLEQVHRGLGEMQALASDVGDLKRVLANVKTRGIWGEVQLSALLEQMLAPGQYAANVATVPGSSERVEFAIRLPGRDAAVWLPVDAKFPREDWERLQQAHDRADAVAADEAGRALEARIRLEARRIRDKYLSPPATTDFALMFLPTEGLYAEVVRRAGLVDELQREHRVVLAGPTTLCALLNSLQMGFRTFAVEQRTSEVWAVLGAVKTEFGKFGDVLAKTKQQLQTVSNSLDTAEVRSRAIVRRLRDVEELPAAQAGALLPDEDAPDR
ncbi:MAG: DNA recombination protein RmuC [Burkholderiales bacterium]|nr:MAG: DNA recombination protein RmuC [Burkholderiales bacterium]